MAKARGTAGVAVPKPFEQGDLDGLCGVYTVVNAVRLAAHPHRRLPAAECRGLFAALLAELAAGRGGCAASSPTGSALAPWPACCAALGDGCARGTGSRSRSAGRSPSETSPGPGSACGC